MEDIEAKLLEQADKGELIVTPKELDGAPQDIIDHFIKWVEIDKVMKNHPRRYFNFVSQKNGELVTLDAMAFYVNLKIKAKRLGVNEAELPRVKDACEEMKQLILQKSQLKRKWLVYVRSKLGKNVFDWRKADIIEQYGKYATHDEILQWLGDNGYTAKEGELLKFFLNNKDTIEKKRIEFIRSSRDHYLATDAGRMETLAMLHAKFMILFQDAFNGNVNSKRNDELIALSREIRGIIEQARKEIKGEEVRLTVDGKIDINASIQAAATIQDISRKLPINIIPVYLVAAKMGMDPNRIIASLVGSFYKEYNGFSRINGTDTPPTTMDLIRNYDWNEIQRFQGDKANEKVQTVSYEDIPFVEVQKIQSKREKLLEMINKETTEKP